MAECLSSTEPQPPNVLGLVVTKDLVDHTSETGQDEAPWEKKVDVAVSQKQFPLQTYRILYKSIQCGSVRDGPTTIACAAAAACWFFISSNSL